MDDIKVTNMVKFYTICMLYEGPKHGYEIIKTIGEKINKKVSPGQIYPFLAKLEKNKLVTSGKRGERDKKAYSLTPEGKKFTQDMLHRFGDLVELAIESNLTKCAHCGCEVFRGGYKEKIGNKEITFCCSHCAASSGKGGHNKH